MHLPDMDRPRRDQPYMMRKALAAAHRIFAVVDDLAVPTPTGPLPFAMPRAQGVFDRIMAACRPGQTPDDVLDVRLSSALPPPRQRRRR